MLHKISSRLWFVAIALGAVLFLYAVLLQTSWLLKEKHIEHKAKKNPNKYISCYQMVDMFSSEFAITKTGREVLQRKTKLIDIYCINGSRAIVTYLVSLKLLLDNTISDKNIVCGSFVIVFDVEYKFGEFHTDTQHQIMFNIEPCPDRVKTDKRSMTRWRLGLPRSCYE